MVIVLWGLTNEYDLISNEESHKTKVRDVQ